MKRDDLLDLNEALQHPGKKVSVDISTELHDEGDIDLKSPVEGYLEAVSTGTFLLITGQFQTLVSLDCARCTSPLDVPLSFDLDEQFPVVGIPSSYSASDCAKVAAEEEYPLFEGNALMVDALLRQAVVLAMPVQPLCAAGWDTPCPIADRLGVSPSGNADSGGLAEIGKIMHGRLKDDPADRAKVKSQG